MNKKELESRMEVMVLASKILGEFIEVMNDSTISVKEKIWILNHEEANHVIRVSIETSQLLPFDPRTQEFLVIKNLEKGIFNKFADNNGL